MPIAQIKQKNKSGRKHTRVYEFKDEHKLKEEIDITGNYQKKCR